METPEYRTFVVVGGGRGGGKTINDLVNAHKRIHQFESTYGQVSKALCGKENASPDEVLKAVDQLKSRLAQVEREMDAAIRNYIPQSCDTCKYGPCFSFENPCNTCTHLYRFNAVERGDTDNWEYVGVYEENTK